MVKELLARQKKDDLKVKQVEWQNAYEKEREEMSSLSVREVLLNGRTGIKRKRVLKELVLKEKGY